MNTSSSSIQFLWKLPENVLYFMERESKISKNTKNTRLRRPNREKNEEVIKISMEKDHMIRAGHRSISGKTKAADHFCRKILFSGRCD